MSESPVDKSSSTNDDNMQEVYIGPVQVTIPEDWGTARLENISRDGSKTFVDGDWVESEDMAEDGNYQLIQLGNIGEGYFEGNCDKYVSEEFFSQNNCTLVEQGDLLISRLSDPVLRTIIVPDFDKKSITAVDVVVVKVDESNWNKEYIWHLLNSKPLSDAGSSLASGSTRQRINRSTMGDMEIPSPPLPEQYRIATVLSSVNEQIQQTEDIITTLRELKQGLVQDLVFSGIERAETKQIYIGPKPVEIAQSWETKQIGDVTDTVQYGCSESLSQEGQYPMFRMNNIEDGRMVGEPMKYVDLDDETADKYRVEQGDILFNRTNSIDLVGKAGLFNLDEEYVFASYLIRLLTTEEMNPWFLNYFINSSIGQDVMFSIATRGASQANINATNLKNVRVPAPPREEQDKIVERIQTVEEKREKEQATKTRLQELKRGLMQDLLTGKVRTPPDLLDQAAE